jgi:hypothetical protein
MSAVPSVRDIPVRIFFCLLVLFLVSGVQASASTLNAPLEPGVYLNFNEGIGTIAMDASGHGNAGTITGAERVDSGGCGQALVFDGTDDYVSIPFSSENHPEKQISVSTWFYVDSYYPQVLISSYDEGGYRLGFDDGSDLWWTINLEGSGDVSIPVQHEGITLSQWHHVVATYDGKTSKIYLDGILRNEVNASGPIHYEYQNYVMLGADAGPSNTPDSDCPQYFGGGLDEVKIYDTALTYSQVMDDRFSCSMEPVVQSQGVPKIRTPVYFCTGSGTFYLGAREPVSRVLTFFGRDENETLKIITQPGSTLIAKVSDRYTKPFPDTWYVEISDEHGRATQSIISPNTSSTLVTAIIPSGNATIIVSYYDGKDRFPSSAALWFESIPPPPPLSVIQQNILINPIIVIYSASWATLIALILVVVWLHRRRIGSK